MSDRQPQAHARSELFAAGAGMCGTFPRHHRDRTKRYVYAKPRKRGDRQYHACVRINAYSFSAIDRPFTIPSGDCLTDLAGQTWSKPLSGLLMPPLACLLELPVRFQRS